MQAKILRLNAAGQPIEWLDWQSVASLYSRELVLWSLGQHVKHVRGGMRKLTGLQSELHLPAIVACGGGRLAPMRLEAPLTNRALFYRDQCQCLYCGQYFDFADLSRDHVHPRSRGGEDKWENVVTACKRCNQRKGDKLLTEIDMPLLALPFKPNPYEYLALINSARILPDQIAYLEPSFSQYRPAA